MMKKLVLGLLLTVGCASQGVAKVPYMKIATAYTATMATLGTGMLLYRYLANTNVDANVDANVNAKTESGKAQKSYLPFFLTLASFIGFGAFLHRSN